MHKSREVPDARRSQQTQANIPMEPHHPPPGSPYRPFSRVLSLRLMNFEASGYTYAPTTSQKLRRCPLQWAHGVFACQERTDCPQSFLFTASAMGDRKSNREMQSIPAGCRCELRKPRRTACFQDSVVQTVRPQSRPPPIFGNTYRDCNHHCNNREVRSSICL